MQTPTVNFSQPPADRRIRAEVITRGLSLALAGLGGYILIEIAKGLPATLRRPSVGDLLLDLLLDAIGLSICVCFLGIAWMGWRHRSAASIRGLCIVSTIVGCFFGMYMADRLGLVPDMGSNSIGWRQVLEFLGVFLATGVYYKLSRFLIARLGLKDERTHAQQVKSIKRWVGALVFLLWGSIGPLIMKHFPKGPHTEREMLLTLVAPLLLAAVVYKFSVWLLTPRQRVKASPLLN